MTEFTFEAALQDRTAEMLDACTKCGKCVEVCPSAQPANITDADPSDVTTLSRLQLEREALERLGQGAASQSTPDEAPDFVFYTGCNVLKTPHIALLALDIMDVLGISYRAMGGPSHCCGVMQLRAGDV